MKTNLDFERRRPYQEALELNCLVIQVCNRVENDKPLWAEELSRSAVELLQYLATGYGVKEYHVREQAFSNAGGAFYRVISALLIAQQYGFATDEELELARKQGSQIKKLPNIL
ncbi:MAG: four helix bundle protein [Anaerolineales bacterium]|nr:four helix bundle protein [Anaerolineales bacterium]